MCEMGDEVMGYLYGQKVATFGPKSIHLVLFHSGPKAVSYDQVLPNEFCE
jgi:hypothetical protein